MKKTSYLISTAILACFIAGCSGPTASAKPATESRSSAVAVSDAEASLPFEKFFEYETFTLDNGLRVIVHEDRSAPAISVTSYFHVGSKNEPLGKTGFAHLFEHLLFNGTVNAPGEFFTHLDEIGASGTNGTTSYDRTNYYQTVPTGALERMLWLESDRMTTFLDGMTQESLDTQIDVVKNEKGLSDNAPFGAAIYDQIAQIYPANHPYSRSVIGSIADLENATLDDARQWFIDYYGARNTILILSGDVDLATAKPLVEKYFNRMEAGPGISRPKAMPVRRLENTYQIVTDVAPDSSLERAFVLPPATSRDDYLPSIALNIFASGQQSSLYRRLVNDKKVARRLSLSAIGGELNQAYLIRVTPAEGVSLQTLSDELDAAFSDFLEAGPQPEDIEQYQGYMRSLYISATESLQLKASVLGEGLMYHDDPHYDLKIAKWTDAVEPGELKTAANEWLSKGYHQTLKIAQTEAIRPESDVDFSVKPPVLPTAVKPLPEPERFNLSNGLEVVYVHRENSPRVVLDFVSPIGRAHYDPETALHAQFINRFLLEGGAGGVDRETFSQKKTVVGADIHASVSRKYTGIAVSTDVEAFDQALEIWADVLLEPNFSSEDFDYFRRLSVQTLESDKKSPNRVASQIAGLKLYGDLYDTFDEEIAFWKASSPDQALRMKREIVRPEGAKLYVVGGVERDVLVTRLEEELKGWRGKVEPRPILRRDIEPSPERPRFILVNDEGSTQTRVTGIRKFPLEDGDHYIEDIANDVWGGGFTSRLNLNLREDKGWTYGIGSGIGARPEMDSTWSIGGSVTGKHTVESVREIIKEIDAINGARPITQDELAKTVDPMIKSYANRFGVTFALMPIYFNNDLLGKPHSYIGEYTDRLEAVTVDQVMERARHIIRSDDMTWVLVGDLSTFEADLREANLGDVEVYDLSGERIR